MAHSHRDFVLGTGHNMEKGRKATEGHGNKRSREAGIICRDKVV